MLLSGSYCGGCHAWCSDRSWINSGTSVLRLRSWLVVVLARANAAALPTELSSAAGQRQVHIADTEELVSSVTCELHEWLRRPGERLACRCNALTASVKPRPNETSIWFSCTFTPTYSIIAVAKLFIVLYFCMINLQKLTIGWPFLVACLVLRKLQEKRKKERIQDEEYTGCLTLLKIFWKFAKSSGNFLAEFMRLLLLWLTILVFQNVSVGFIFNCNCNC